MDDEGIIRLYWQRDEQAIRETDRKYGGYCRSIAWNILYNREDAEECVNDTWLQAWRAMPPRRPGLLSAFLGKITRNLSFDLYRRNHRQKRGGYEMELVLDELGECVSGNDDPVSAVEGKLLLEEIDRFLKKLPEQKRRMFVLRYFYAESISDIAEKLSLSENNVSVTLNRIRGTLRDYLTRRGFDL